MIAIVISHKEAVFRSEGRLLQELGERLVASPEVALLELIKNAYDADSHPCRVFFERGRQSLVIEDEGKGMTEAEFLGKWMHIATGTKVRDVRSKGYGRKLTGAKGIGRFAVRFLGRKLELKSVAYDDEAKEKRKIEAVFDWDLFDNASSIEDVKVPYTISTIDQDDAAGTTLTISKLKSSGDEVFSRQVRTEILRLTSPLSGLENGGFSRSTKSSVRDPGFIVFLPGHEEDEQDSGNLAASVLANFWGRVTLSLKGDRLSYVVYLSGKKEPDFQHSQRYPTDIAEGLFADIRFFPYRAGVFSAKEVDGRLAWKWVRENSGVAVIDHGFRMKPYGYPDDDWLLLAQSEARSERDWRSNVMRENYSMPEEIRQAEGRNYALNLSKNHQLVGAVFVESSQPKTKDGNAQGLVPASDRMGLVANKAFLELQNIVRGGLEMLAWRDKLEMERREAEEAQRLAKETRGDLQKAIKEIEQSATLTSTDKKRIIVGYRELSDRIEDVDEYNRKAREGLETMALLGVVAGFMTHESRRIAHDLEKIIKTLRRTIGKYPEVRALLEDMEDAYQEFSGQVAYASTFIGAVQESQMASFKAVPQIQRVINAFGSFLKEKGIEVIVEGDSDILTPPLQVALYSGIVLNLYTNAMKAVMAGPSDNQEPRIAIKVWNESDRHILEVADNGVGIPETLKARIWDPLFTTTSRMNNPLGSGMGLGLTLIRKLVKNIDGSISLVDAPPGFSTCFRVEFRLKGKMK